MLNLETIFPLLVTVNLISFIIYGVDKYKAVKGKWRVSENALLMSAAIAPFGALLGMRAFRHKVRKARFSITVPVLAIVHILLYLHLAGTIALI